MPILQYTPVSKGNFTATDGSVFLKPSFEHASSHPGIVLFATSFNLLETEIDDHQNPSALDQRSLLGAIALCDDPARKKRLNDLLHNLLFDVPFNSQTSSLYDIFKPSSFNRLHPSEYLLFDNPREQIEQMLNSTFKQLSSAYQTPPTSDPSRLDSLLKLYAKHLPPICPQLSNFQYPSPTIFL